ncbi:hypothetical protein CALCODRAFT_506378 [Calocera cornea HHB12733]|uniref:Uncharacterized protein n=1 Tax=Calocera cornea HHB12733 TaxID=1353952 RepID=A0A165IZ17_9BASI|nr:hypothetical protein CALCODRAFT_506378 [Calocera cornea HHB12733]
MIAATQSTTSDTNALLKVCPPATPTCVFASSAANRSPLSPSANTKIDSLIHWTKEAGYNLSDAADLANLQWGVPDKADVVVLHDGDEPVHLTLVAHISEDNFNLTPHGGWQKDNTFSRNLSKQKASTFLVNPKKAPFDLFFESALRNINNLQQKVAHPGTEIMSVIWDGGICISWLLFERKPTSGGDNWPLLEQPMMINHITYGMIGLSLE